MVDSNVPWFSTASFLPHGHCYLWTPSLVWMHVASDILIGMAYFAIPFVLFQIVRKRTDLPFDWMFGCFSLFIFACGFTHFVAAWNVWHTEYWIEGLVKVTTALVSVPTAILLWRLVPHVLDLPSRKELQETNEALGRSNRELEAFSAAVSHDLRSPLSTIAGQAGLLTLSLGNKLTSDEQRRLAKIEGGVKQMAELLDALLALSRISRHTLFRETVDVTGLAQEIAAELRLHEPDREVEIVMQSGMHVHGDRRLIGDLFSNVIGNAWKFTRNTSHPRIEIGQTRQGSMSTLYVRDNGAGFDMAYAQKLFQPFQRLHSADEFSGHGVGLATVARIVARHGGRIWTEARPGQGATFYFTLPVTAIVEKGINLHPATLHPI